MHIPSAVGYQLTLATDMGALQVRTKYTCIYIYIYIYIYSYTYIYLHIYLYIYV